MQLKDIIHESINENVINWKYKEVNEEIRCYYKRIEYNIPNEKVGFNFCIIQIVAFERGKEEFYKKNYAEIMYEGTAYFDGIRHLYMGSETTKNFGYHYYPSIEDNIKSLQVLREK